MIKALICFLISLLVVCACNDAYADDLPVCSNKVINEVTKRSGCTVGDTKCWFAQRGFCTDYVQSRIASPQSAKPDKWLQVSPEMVKKGDIAQFYSPRAHYAFVESVVKDKQGRVNAVNVSEYNFGTCWVDPDAFVTNTYKIVTKRSGIPVGAVDSGFWRP